MRIYRRVIIAVVAVAALAATPAFAQGGGGGQRPAPAPKPNVNEGIGFGVEAGITRSTIRDTGDETADARAGWMAGIWFGGNRGGRLGFMGEITYQIKGADDPGSGESLKLHYLEIPAVFRVNLGSKAKNGASVYVLFGPVVDILLKGEFAGVDVKDQFNGYDIGFLGGVGFEVARIGIEARGNWGLKGIVSDSNGGFSDIQDSKNFALQVLAKIRFN